jgi:hypothetical protein
LANPGHRYLCRYLCANLESFAELGGHAGRDTADLGGVQGSNHLGNVIHGVQHILESILLCNPFRFLMFLRELSSSGLEINIKNRSQEKESSTSYPVKKGFKTRESIRNRSLNTKTLFPTRIGYIVLLLKYLGFKMTITKIGRY